MVLLWLYPSFAALLENHQTPKGIKIPKALAPIQDLISSNNEKVCRTNFVYGNFGCSILNLGGKNDGMLDSMVVLSKSHESVIASVDSTKVQQAYLEMGDFKLFLANVDEMMEMGVPKIMFTGPLYKMENCVKYYGRVLGSYTSELTPNTTLNSFTLQSAVESNALDSALAIKYFNDEAFALRDANQRINKSYGACFECKKA